MYVHGTCNVFACACFTSILHIIMEWSCLYQWPIICVCYHSTLRNDVVCSSPGRGCSHRREPSRGRLHHIFRSTLWNHLCCCGPSCCKSMCEREREGMRVFCCSVFFQQCIIFLQVLSVFDEIHVKKLLHILVFGESLLNGEWGCTYSDSWHCL